MERRGEICKSAEITESPVCRLDTARGGSHRNSVMVQFEPALLCLCRDGRLHSSRSRSDRDFRRRLLANLGNSLSPGA
jgi:hypothetical protein